MAGVPCIPLVRRDLEVEVLIETVEEEEEEVVVSDAGLVRDGLGLFWLELLVETEPLTLEDLVELLVEDFLLLHLFLDLPLLLLDPFFLCLLLLNSANKYNSLNDI